MHFSNKPFLLFSPFEEFDHEFLNTSKISLFKKNRHAWFACKTLQQQFGEIKSPYRSCIFWGSIHYILHPSSK